VIIVAYYRDSREPKYIGADSWAEALTMALRDKRELMVLKWEAEPENGHIPWPDSRS
jgi:hypothetical protein